VILYENMKMLEHVLLPSDIRAFSADVRMQTLIQS